METKPRTWEERKTWLDNEIKIKGISTFGPPVDPFYWAGSMPLTDSGQSSFPPAVSGTFLSETLLAGKATTQITQLVHPVSEIPALALIHYCIFTTARREVRGPLLQAKISCSFPHKTELTPFHRLRLLDALGKWLTLTLLMWTMALCWCMHTL